MGHFQIQLKFLLVLFVICPIQLGAQMTVVSYNIRYDNSGDSLNSWTFRKAEMVTFLKSQKPDILSLQEVLNHQ